MTSKTETAGVDSTVEDYLTKNHADAERAVITNYGFSVKSEQGQFVVVDPVYRKANRGKGGKYGPGGNLELLIQSAVKNRGTVADMPPKPTAEPAKKKNGKTTDEKKEVAPEARRTRATRVDDATHDDASNDEKATGRRRARGAVKKDNRFVRAFRLIAREPDISPDAIARGANLSLKMAGGCRVAWAAAVQVMEEVKEEVK
ncbi:MAG: hypothetical protein KGO96_10410 [Elusimicrobia bacterium]|nr:hypothetical protein [Elusimicrobiota bacterium]